MNERIVRIGGASGGETDGSLGIEQFLSGAGVDYIILDYLAEPSMGPLGRLAEADPAKGYQTAFLEIQILPHLSQIKEQGVRIVSNAGGLNPRGLAAAIEAAAAQRGISIAVAAVEGDDLRRQEEVFRSEGVREMFSGAEFPQNITGINAYLGAFPIAEALALGADIVVTGRAADSALALGPLIHEFGWGPDEFDLLAAGTTAGHLLECGAQVSGGTFTDWRDVPGWERPGYPIGECRADGTLVLSKTQGTGGLISVGTVSEQLLYEVSDPQAYIVPDVVCDFSQVQLTDVGANRVQVSGAKGYAPTNTYKVCLTHNDGWRSTGMSPIIGFEAVAKARRRATALLSLTSRMLGERGLPDWRLTHSEVIGAEESYGTRSLRRDNREVVSKIVVEHVDKAAAELFAREERASQMSMSVGTASGIGAFFAAGPVQQISRLFSFLIDKSRVPISVTVGGVTKKVTVPLGSPFETAELVRPEPNPLPQQAVASVPLIALAYGRSGDKGDLFNVAIIARRADYLPYIAAALDAAAVGAWFAHFLANPASPRVDRYEVPGTHALNFVVHRSLSRGVASGSPILDRSAKGMAQQLLEMPVPVSPEIADEVRDRLSSIQAFADYATH